MAESWYSNSETKEQILFSGIESEYNEDLDSVFQGFLNSVDNAYDIIANRNNVTDISTRVIIQSNPLSKHNEKTILFENGVLRIGDYINYNSKKFLISSWVNDDISMNDSAPMNFCNAEITYVNVVKTDTETVDDLGRPIFTTVSTDKTISSVFDTSRIDADSGRVVNLETGIVECWVQYVDDLMYGLNKIVKVFDKNYSIDGIMRDMVSNDGSNNYGVLRLKLRVKE